MQLFDFQYDYKHRHIFFKLIIFFSENKVHAFDNVLYAYEADRE